MKFSAKQTAQFIKKPDPIIRLALFFGIDQGMVHERARFLTKTVVGDPNDPFRVSLLTGAQIEQDPARLIDEASAQSLVGGKRVVLVELDGKNISDALDQYLENGIDGSLVIIKAGELKTTSPVRKLIEKSNYAAAMPAYTENKSSLNNLIDSVLLKNGVSISSDSKQYLINNLGLDRQVSRSELEKLMTYLGGKKELKLEDAMLVIGDSDAFSIDQVVYAAANGNRVDLDRKLFRAFNEGQMPIFIVRAAIKHFQKLHLASGHIKNGKSFLEALNSVKPPVFFLLKDQFMEQLNKWSLAKVEKALDLLTQAEIDCKTTGLPEKFICGRVLMSLSQAARQ